MPKIASRYKNKISAITMDALNNFINSKENPEEEGFKDWLKGKKLYYLNRIVNEVVKRNPITNLQAMGYVAIEVYKIMERDYEQNRTNEETADIGNS